MGIYGIYNAEGGIIGDFKYVFQKLTKTRKCYLCDITHTLAWTKRDWQELNSRISEPLILLHINEQDDDMRSFTEGKTPCVIRGTQGAYNMLLTDDDLSNCAGNVAIFESLLTSRLSDSAQ